MRYFCVLCNRPMHQPAVLIAGMPVGAKCARRAGLVELAKRQVGKLKLAQKAEPLPARAKQQGFDFDNEGGMDE